MVCYVLVQVNLLLLNCCNRVEPHSDILNKVMTFGGRQHNILDMGSERMVINVYLIIAHILGFYIGSKH